MVDPTSTRASGSRLISRVLPPAIRFWLSSQLDQVENLVFRIEGRDRDILSGHIPQVFLSAQKAVYQGIHLSQAVLQASDIRVNLGQVMRRKPLRLLAPFPVSGEVCLTTADLNQSLQAPLLGEGLYDFLRLLAKSQPEAAHLNGVLDRLAEPTVSPYFNATASIEADGIHAVLQPKSGADLPTIAIATQLAIKDGRRLCLENPHWLNEQDPHRKTPLPALQEFEIDLGSQITLTECSVEPGKLALAGTLRVLPKKGEEE